MLASFAFSAGYSPYDYTNFTEQVKSTFLPTGGEINGVERVAYPTTYTHFTTLPVNSTDENGSSCQQKITQETGNGYGNGIIYRSPVGRPLAEKMLKALMVNLTP